MFLKIKNVNKIKKTLKNVKNVTGIKNAKNDFYIYAFYRLRLLGDDRMCGGTEF